MSSRAGFWLRYRSKLKRRETDLDRADVFSVEEVDHRLLAPLVGQHALVTGIGDDYMYAVLKRLSHLISLERLGVVVELAAKEEGRNIRFDRRAKLVAEVRPL